MKKFRSLTWLLSSLLISVISSTHLFASPYPLFDEVQERSHFREKYTLVDEIGRGTYSTVFLSKNDRGELVVIKKYSIEDQKLIDLLEQNGCSVDTYLKQIAENELQIGQLTDHENIVKIKEAWLENSAAYVAMEYVKGYPLSYSDNHPFETRVVLMQQFLSALEHLLLRNVIADDLWSGNILISPEGNRLTLIDLGGYEMIDEATMPVGHYLEMIEHMLEQIGGEASKIVNNCKNFIPKALRKETISAAHLRVLVSWIEAMQKELSTPLCLNNTVSEANEDLIYE